LLKGDPMLDRARRSVTALASVLILSATALGARDARAADERAGGMTSHSTPPPDPVHVVARDWDGASSLAGALAATDEIRATRTSRMLVTRVGGGGWLSPFVQVGFGQWRVPDPRVALPCLHYATQAGAGIQATITRTLAFAVEYDWTALYAEPARVEAAAFRYLGWGEAFAVFQWRGGATR
jgi:hypothetical protein